MAPSPPTNLQCASGGLGVRQGTSFLTPWPGSYRSRLPLTLSASAVHPECTALASTAERTPRCNIRDAAHGEVEPSR